MALSRHRFEALLLSTSVSAAAAVVYTVKLRETQWYWGSSFPSGHTLVAAFATAGALVVGRLCPVAREAALVAALAWIMLGVHWPTDVLAAACVGAALLLALAIALDARRRD